MIFQNNYGMLEINLKPHYKTMAENKNKIIVYRDWITTFNSLNNEEAGVLIKHFFEYINDKDPNPPDRLTKLLFEPIKQTLRRDLKTYEAKCLKNKENVNIRWNTMEYERTKMDTNHTDSDSDSDIKEEEEHIVPTNNTNVYERTKTNKDTSLKKTINVRNQKYITLARYLSRIIRTKKNIRHTPQQLSTWTNDIRQLEENNKIEFTRIKTVLEFYEKHIGEQYIPVIESGNSLKEKFIKLENAIDREKFPKNNNKPKFKFHDDIKFTLDEVSGRYKDKTGDTIP